jgi:hypothetical protein
MKARRPWQLQEAERGDAGEDWCLHRGGVDKWSVNIHPHVGIIYRSTAEVSIQKRERGILSQAFGSGLPFAEKGLF